MITAKKFAEQCSWFEPTEKELEILKEYAKEAIKADRKNVAKHAKYSFSSGVDKSSIINAPEIELL